MPAEVRRGLRADARDNRARILAGARAAVAATGGEVPVREIARHAGVGVATVYRHFPSRDALLAEAATAGRASCASIIGDGLAAADAFQGLRRAIEELIVVHARERDGRRPALSPVRVAADREHALGLLAELVRRARAGGGLRDDVVVDDVVLLLMAGEGIRATSADRRVAASRRFADLLTRSLAAQATSATGGVGPT